MDKNPHQEVVVELVSQKENQFRLVIKTKILLYIIMPPKMKEKKKSLTQLQKQYFTQQVDEIKKKKSCCNSCSKNQHCGKKCDEKKS